MNVYVNERCIKCGMCARYHSDCFVLKEKAEVIEGIDFNEYSEQLQDAYDFCPVSAIVLEKD